MTQMVHYAITAQDSFEEHPLSRVDSLVFSWLAYLRLSCVEGAGEVNGVPLAELGQASVRTKLIASLHDMTNSSMLVQAVAASPRFGQVRVCLHTTDSSEQEGRQFSATTFLLPGGGVYVAFRGTDNTVLGWKENIRLACATSVPSEDRAVSYLEEAAFLVDGPLWVGGHSKGGLLAAYACAHASDAVRTRVQKCFSHDGPGASPELRASATWHDDVPFEKTVPRDSLVGMIFERSQGGFVVVRSSEIGPLQHSPFSWEVRGDDFVCEQGLSYDAWRLSQRLNDWLEEMGPQQRSSFAELLCWLMDATGEASFSGLLDRWSSNSQAMREALERAPEADRELFARAMDDLVATLLLGSRQELRPESDEPEAKANYAARRVEDAAARVNDRLSQLDRLTGR